MSLNQNVLHSEQVVAWATTSKLTGATPAWVYTGRDDFGVGGIQIAVASVTSSPTRELMKNLHSARKGKLNIQLVVAAIYAEQMWVFGPDDKTAVAGPLAIEQGYRQLQSALDEPNALAAYTRLGQFRRSLDTTSLVGVTNSGLFASYHIRENVPKRSDWQQACVKSKPWLSLRTDQLIKALGFKSEKTAGNALLLSSDTPRPRAVAILLDESEQFDSTSARHTGISPVAFGLNVAARQGVPWLLVLRKDQIRIYPAKDGVGVGQKGQVETYLEIDLAAIDSERAGLLALIFSADALEPNGTAHELLEGSKRFASQLGLRLRERIYEHVVPQLSKSVAEHLRDQGTTLDSDGLNLAFRLTLRILFRLLFQAYAEDRGLLPAGRNEGYDANSLKTLAKRIIDIPQDDFGSSKSLWLDLVQVWNAIDEGNSTWSVPAYNGGLFGTDPELHPEGALIEQLGIQDIILGPVLQHLLIDISEDNVRGPVDFRSLSVREFGTIYEGLLESSLSVAVEPLTIDSRGTWVPASKKDSILANKGDVYFHSASGERKATGSYFTPGVVVDHLITSAVDPALDSHLERIRVLINSGDGAAAAKQFFDFRVADLAMGSGHFLVAAVDRIEAKMRTFLTEKETQIPAINAELNRIALVAKESLGKDETAVGEIEPAALLRRQIARRCIYGLDINPLAVELSRLAIWIHTFVPGLPMSNLDHGLVCANSLTGIGTIAEAHEALSGGEKEGFVSLFGDTITENLTIASELLMEVANSDEAIKAEVKAAARINVKAKKAAAPTKSIFDAALAIRIGEAKREIYANDEKLIELGNSPAVKKAVDALNAAHMPFLFPEVFLRENPGFDVILGNPPWEELVYEEIKFWALRNPGLRGKQIKEQLKTVAKLRIDYPALHSQMTAEMEATNTYRRILMSGPYKGMGSGHADLYKAFCWRFQQLARGLGYIGVVLPRGALTAAGSSDWRQNVIATSHFVETVFLANSGGWVFPSVHQQYSIGLAVIQKDTAGKTILAGPFTSEQSFKAFSESKPTPMLEGKSILDWSETFAFPLLPSTESVEVFTKLRRGKSLGIIKDKNFEFAPVQGDFNQTTDRDLVYLENPQKGELLAYKGASFNLWTPSTGESLGSASKSKVDKFMNAKLTRSSRMASSAFFNMKRNKTGEFSFTYENPRIAMRLITNQTNTRTVISCLIPPNVILGNGAPFLVRRAGDEKAEAYLLGVLSSIPLDWYARRFVELNMNFHILNGFPIPEYSASPVNTRIIELAGSLASVNKLYAAWAKKVGVKTGTLLEDVARQDAVAEIDALVALAYKLNRKDLIHIFETFHKGWNYNQRLEMTLVHFDNWSKI